MMKPKILVTGASGYVGGRLIPLLLERNYSVRAMVRDCRKLERRGWEGLEIVEADALEPESLAAALAGVEVAYYLIHSMTTSGPEFRKKDIQCAENFAEAANRASVKRIIYLGGLGNTDAGLSEHLKSRQETGEILRSTGIPVTELRAAIIVGSGSASFEIIKDLCKKLPVMITPRWVQSKCEPISIRQLLTYLVGVLEEPKSTGKTLDVGGGEVLTYAEMMQQCGEVMGKRILMIPVPVLTPRLSSYWLNLVTSVPLTLARPLVEGLKNDVVTQDSRIKQWIPAPELSYRKAVERAFAREASGDVITRWTDAATSKANERFNELGFHYIDARTVAVNAPPVAVFSAIERMGGAQGWYHADWLWRLRAAMDWLVGGVGMRRGKPSEEEFRVGDPIDFFRVEDRVFPKLIALRAEMKLPGIARLTFNVAPLRGEEQSILQLRAKFWPRGVFGKLYWYAVLPLHNFVFNGMLRGIKAEAEKHVPIDIEAGSRGEENNDSLPIVDSPTPVA